MATLYGTQMAKLQANQEIDVTQAGGRVRAFVETVVLAAQAIGDAIHVGRIPSGAQILGYLINTNTSLAAATLAISGGPGVAASLFTTIDTPVLAGATPGAVLPAETDIVATVGVAALPAAGIVTITTLYTLD